MKILAIVFVLWSAVCVAQTGGNGHDFKISDTAVDYVKSFPQVNADHATLVIIPDDGSLMLWASVIDTTKTINLICGRPAYGHLEYEFADGTVLFYRREAYSCRGVISIGSETCYWKKNGYPISDADVYRQFINTNLVAIRQVQQQHILETIARPTWWKRTRWHYRIRRDVNECLRKQGFTDYLAQMWYSDIVVDVKGPYGRYAYNNLHAYYVSSEVRPDAATAQWLRERIKELSGAHI